MNRLINDYRIKLAQEQAAEEQRRNTLLARIFSKLDSSVRDNMPDEFRKDYNKHNNMVSAHLNALNQRGINPDDILGITTEFKEGEKAAEALIMKVAQAIAQEQATSAASPSGESVYIKRRRITARVLSALTGGVIGLAVGGPVGAGLGGAAGYGANYFKENALGLDPLSLSLTAKRPDGNR
jgi:hypothetical protein